MPANQGTFTSASAVPRTAAAADDAWESWTGRVPSTDVMVRMTDDEWREFVAAGTRTGKLTRTRRDGSPHVVPIWFVLDGDDLVFNTGSTTIKGRNLARTDRAVSVSTMIGRLIRL